MSSQVQMFSWKNKKKINIFWLKNASSLENIKAATATKETLKALTTTTADDTLIFFFFFDFFFFFQKKMRLDILCELPA